MAKLPWKPWHEVVHLRKDLKSGELPLYMFAADLYEVLMQGGKQPAYEKLESFFALTYPTHNLRNLVREVVLRLAGKNDKAVRQLELTYGGGKTHTLITLRHLVHDPDHLPDLPAVHEFIEAIGQKPPKCRVAGLCFDKLDVEKAVAVRGPDGRSRKLRQPWSALAYQIAGDDGLRLLHAEDKAEERDTAPAESLLSDLLALPLKDDLGTLVLIDEVLMYAREKVGDDPVRLNSLVNFFQYLTQAATKVPRCCIVASLLTSEPTNQDALGRRIQGQLYDIFQRQREEAVEPVLKEDVAEVLRRRFFTPESLKDRDAFRQHVIAALKGIQAVDEQTAREGAAAEERYLRSYPFHPDMTDVFYVKWTQLARFQRTRGVLRTFALALREAEKWDPSPLVGPAVFLSAPEAAGLSEATRELVTVADTEEYEGKTQAWTGILDGELGRARQIQTDSVGIRMREIEQAVMATFLHSQPIAQSARTRDLVVLLGAGRPDKIEMEKGLGRWARQSYWLDDVNLPEKDDQLPGQWRLGNRPNLNQMHAAAVKEVTDDVVRSMLLNEIDKVKSLTTGASALGVRVHTLPPRPREIEDDGQFRYAVLGPSAASDSGKPSAEAKRFIDEKSGPDKPRVYRNAVIALVPSRDGLDQAMDRVRDHLAWENVRAKLTPRNETEKDQKAAVDVAKMQTLKMNIDKARGKVGEAIRQAYCIVVTVSDKDEVQAFKIQVTDAPHFETIKADERTRVKDTAITADALLPGGPYDLWKGGEKSRRVKDLAGAFAQMPHLPKMLKAQAIVDTLVDGCSQGAFVMRLARPDRSVRTWWRSRPDEAALAEPGMELVLSEAAELADVPADLLAPQALPGLWKGDEITAQNVLDYFSGNTVVEVDKGTHKEPMLIPRVPADAVERAITEAVAAGKVWLLSGPASLLAETVPPGVLAPASRLRVPPTPLAPAEILPENLTSAWQKGHSTALSIATALSQKTGQTLPWKTVRDVIGGALQARFLELAEGSSPWPCDLPAAQTVRLRVAKVPPPPPPLPPSGGVLVASGDFEPSQMQDLGDLVPRLLEAKAKAGVPMKFQVQLRVGDGQTRPPEAVAKEINDILRDFGGGFLLH